MFKDWILDENGQGMTEYGFIIGLIALVVIVSLVVLGPKIRNLFTGVGEAMPTVTVT